MLALGTKGRGPEEVVHARNVIAFFAWAYAQAFVTEAVPLGELLHEEALFGPTGVRKDPKTLILDWTLPLSHISSSMGMARPFTNKIEMGWKNLQTLHCKNSLVKITKSSDICGRT